MLSTSKLVFKCWCSDVGTQMMVLTCWYSNVGTPMLVLSCWYSVAITHSSPLLPHRFPCQIKPQHLPPLSLWYVPGVLPSDKDPSSSWCVIGVGYVSDPGRIQQSLLLHSRCVSATIKMRFHGFCLHVSMRLQVCLHAFLSTACVNRMNG